MVDTKLLKAKMILEDVTTKDIAESLDLTCDAVRRKVRGSSFFSLEQAQAMKKILNLTDEEFQSIFFSE